MSISTHSKFYYGFTVDRTNFALDIDEGSGEINLEIPYGNYTLAELAQAVEDELNDGGLLTYTVTVDRATRKLTIAGSANFSLLINSGANAGFSVFSTIGFNGADLSGDDRYESDTAVGTVYTTQFILQSFRDSEHSKASRNPTVNTSASGSVELFRYGVDELFEMDFQYVTNRAVGALSPIRENLTGVSELVALLEHLTSKKPAEFMPDEDDEATYFKVYLESTPGDKNGASFKLNELLTKGLPGFYNTGVLIMRVKE